MILDYATPREEARHENARTVVLRKALGEPFGFKISTNPGVRGVTISGIVLAGVADRCGLLAVGDILLKVCAVQ